MVPMMRIALLVLLAACADNTTPSRDAGTAGCRVVDRTTCNTVEQYKGANLALVECDSFDEFASHPPAGLETCFLGAGLICCAP